MDERKRFVPDIGPSTCDLIGLTYSEMETPND